jgi:hypothetical protein
MVVSIPILSPQFASTGSAKPKPVHAPITGPDQLGFDCAAGATQAVLNGTQFPVADGETGTANQGVFTIDPTCTWVGDLGAFAGVPDGTTEPLVADQDETFTTINTEIGGGFTANIVLLQNATSTVNGFDLTFSYDPTVIRAVTIDQGGLAPWGTNSFTGAAIIDNVAGQVHFVQVIFGSPLPGNFLLFRVRFDVVGVGSTALTWVPGAVSFQNPGTLVVTPVNGAFDSESFFDPSHTLNWKATFSSSPVPAVPGSPLTLTATATCPGCTGAFTYSWRTDSNAATAPLAGNPLTITAPTATLLVHRVNLTIADGAGHDITIVQRLPLVDSVTTPLNGALSENIAGAFTGKWLGGISPYTGSWLFCPGGFSTTICSKPSPAIASTAAQTNTPTGGVIYHFAGVYTDALSIIDFKSTSISGAFAPTVCNCQASPATATTTFLVNVTAPAAKTPGDQAYAVTVSSNSPGNATGGRAVKFTASIAYNSTYPAAFQSNAFSYLFKFGDGTTGGALGTPTGSVTHTYTTSGTFTVTVIAQETAGNALSKIQEVGRVSQTVAPPLLAAFLVSPASPTVGSPATFTATATGGNPPYAYSWDFNDTTATGSGNPVTHTFAKALTYNVTLTVTDSSTSPSKFKLKQQVVVTAPTLHPTTTTPLCTSPVTVGQPSTCNVTVIDTSSTGATTPTGSIGFTSDSQGSFSPTSCTLAGTGNSASCSVNYTPSAVGSGTHMITATYNGDSGHSGGSNTFSLTVSKTSPTITTSLSSNQISQGGSVTDSATLTGVTANAGGTVTYNFFTGSTCGGTATVVGTPVTVTAGVVPSSSAQTFPTAGSFSWNAVYSGDTNNKGTSSACEPLTVNPAISTVTITTSFLGLPGGIPIIVVGTSVVDTATLSGNTATAGGTVTYTLFTASDVCAGASIVVSTVNVANGVVPNSASHTFTSVVPISWMAVYSGDTNNSPATSSCEVIKISVTSPTITTSLSNTVIKVGSSVTDSATLANSFQAGGTVTYSFFTGLTCAGTGTVVGSPVTVTSGAVPSSAAQTFGSAGSFSWNAVYGGDANNNGATSTCEPLTVNPASGVVVTTTLSASTIAVGASVTDSATLTGVTATAGGTVTYNFFTGATCTGTATPVGTPVTVVNGVVPSSSSQAFNTAGSYSWNAVYSGDANNVGATSGCELLAVNKASPTLTTSLLSNPITVGGSVVDTATLAGGFQAGGTVTYNFFTGSACGGTATPVGSPVVVTVGAVPNSASQTFNSAGSLSWNAVYSGDVNNNGITSFCESLTVNKANPTITTTLSANPVTAAASVTDSATISNSFQAGGTVTYSFFTGSTCAGTGTAVGSPVTVTNGLVPNSASQAFDAAGSYSWNAVYSGDVNNNPATSPCEPLAVNMASPTITTTLSSTQIIVGGSVTDSATLNGGFQAGGTVTYNLFSTADCTGTSTIVSTVQVTAGVVPNSASQTFNAGGSFSWNAVYSGDANNNGATSVCEPLTVISSTTKPVLLTFQGFDLDDFDNGVGQLQVLVNGHSVVDIPAGLNHLSGTGDYAPYTNTWVNFGPFDITSFVVQGQNTIVFMSPAPGHFGLIKNVTITQGNVVLLHVAGARFVSLSHSVTFTFSIPPLIITSFTVSNQSPSQHQSVIFTASYTGGTGPFTCTFKFGDEESSTIIGTSGSCSVTHDYDDSGNFKVSIRIRGSSTSDNVLSSINVIVTSTSVVAMTSLVSSSLQSPAVNSLRDDD